MKRLLLFLFVSLSGTFLAAQNFEMKPGQRLSEIRDAVRVWHQANPGKTATVKIASGDYYLDEAVFLGPEDSFTVYEAKDPAAKPNFTRGIEITGWRIAENGWFVTNIESVKNGDWWFECLFVNGKRAVHARTPNADAPEGRRYFYLLNVDEANPSTRFAPRLEQKALFAEIAALPNPEDVKMMCYHSWESSLHRVQSVDTFKNQVTLTGGPRWNLNYWGPNLRYHIEGVESAMDQPGEFLLKRDGTCLYVPRAGETLENVRFFAPSGPKRFEECGFVKFQGSEEKVRDITFRNLKFSCDTWNLPKEGLSDGQSAVSSPISILANRAENLVFESCEVRNIGGYAFHFHQACRNCRVEKCLLEDLGAGGVRIGAGHGTDLSPENLTSETIVQNCIIRGYGRIDAGGIGVWIGHSPKNQVLHNDISDGFYTGVSLGWVWGYRDSAAVENHIEFNHIHHIGWGVLSDMGGVYSLGISPGTTVSNNVIHDVNSYNRYGRGGWGLYTDEGSSNILMENNLVYRTHTGNFHQHYGKENILRNNIFAFSREEQMQRSRPEEHLSFTLERNIIVFDSAEGQTLLRGNWKNQFSALDKNIYWNMDSEAGVNFLDMPLREWQKLGKDLTSIIADPCFVDAKAGDFRFTEDSKPVLEKVGFKPFDFTKAGVLKDDAQWLKESKNYDYPQVVLAPDPPEPPPFVLSDDVETPRRSLILSASNPSGKNGAYRILEENGNHFLRMTDTPDQRYPFDPFFHYRMKYAQNGTARISFDIRVSEQAEMLVEARDNASPYRVGLPMRVNAREISVAGKICDNMPNRWVRIEVSLPIGPDRARNYVLKVTPEGGETLTFSRSVQNDKWNLMTEFVFAALGQVNAELDLDNVKIDFLPNAD